MSLSHAGYIKLFIGPMFASKTSTMIAEVEKFHIANKFCVVVKFSGDTRYDSSYGGIVTHAGREYHQVSCINTTKIADIFDEIKEYEVIGFDEVQFYPDCVEYLQRLANMGKIVIAAGLDGNFLGKPFGQVLELIPLAESVTKLTAVCMDCCGDASFTFRRGTNQEEIDIGGVDKYAALCRKCRWPDA